MKVKLPAAAPRKPLTTPEIKAIERVINLCISTFSLHFIVEVEGDVVLEVPSHASDLDGLHHMEESSMKHLQRTEGERLPMSDEEVATEGRDVISGGLLLQLKFHFAGALLNEGASEFQLPALAFFLHEFVELVVLSLGVQEVLLLGGGSAFHV